MGKTQMEKRSQRLALLRTLCKGSKGEKIDKMLARFMVETGLNREKAQEYLDTLVQADYIDLENGRILEAV